MQQPMQVNIRIQDTLATLSPPLDLATSIVKSACTKVATREAVMIGKGMQN